jgi:hypothetical protein
MLWLPSHRPPATTEVHDRGNDAGRPAANHVVMKRIAAPLVGGILTSFLLELVIYPPVYEIWKRRSVREG